MNKIPVEIKEFSEKYLHISKHVREDLQEQVINEVIETYNSYIEYGKLYTDKTGRDYVDAYKRQDPDFISGWGRFSVKRAATKFQLPEDVKITNILTDTVRAKWIDVPGVDKDFVIMHLHGGGYVQGSIELLEIPLKIAKSTNVRVITVHYGLAPRHPFPEGLEYAFHAYKWLFSSGTDPQNIIFSGDSAGGGIALALLLKLRDEGFPLPRACICLSPWTDLAFQGASYKVNAKRAVTLFEEGLRECVKAYLSGTERDPYHPYASHVYADLTGLPPLLIHVGGLEIFVSDAVQLSEHARIVGVDVNYKLYTDMPHVFQRYDFSLPEVQDSFNEINSFVRSQFNLPLL